MSHISDYSEDPSVLTSSFKQNFDLVSPEEIKYFSESLLHDFEELDRKSFIFGLHVPKKVVELQKWMEENLHPQLQMSNHEPTFFHDCLVLRKVIYQNPGKEKKKFARLKDKTFNVEQIDCDLAILFIVLWNWLPSINNLTF